jgi:hypothetical protein
MQVILPVFAVGVLPLTPHPRYAKKNETEGSNLILPHIT